MTIEIDDAGTGDLVGNAFIGFLRKETGELIFRTLSLELFKGEKWKNKHYLEKTVELVKDGMLLPLVRWFSGYERNLPICVFPILFSNLPKYLYIF